MVANLGEIRGWLGSFLAAYFVLLLFYFSVSIFEDSVWLYVGLASLVVCCIVFFGWFTRINYRHYGKCLDEVSLDKERAIEEEQGKGYAS